MTNINFYGLFDTHSQPLLLPQKAVSFSIDIRLSVLHNNRQGEFISTRHGPKINSYKNARYSC